jgi:hypothetical protein
MAAGLPAEAGWGCAECVVDESHLELAKVAEVSKLSLYLIQSLNFFGSSYNSYLLNVLLTR